MILDTLCCLKFRVFPLVKGTFLVWTASVDGGQW